MTEEEYGSVGLVRETEAPERAVRESNPKKARYTGLSIASLRENIRIGRIKAKIEKYNKEFEKLKELAVEVNEKRLTESEVVEGEEKEDAYSEVKRGIEKYNAQAKKLAKLGVKILAFDEDIQKITLASESSVKAIRVPGFLIGPLRLLTKVGREQARLEKEAKQEKRVMEEKMYDAIVATAQEAIGQEVEDDINAEKFASLESVGTIKDIALDALNNESTVTPPGSDTEEPPVVENTGSEIEKVIINDELFQAAKEKWKQGAHNVFSEMVHGTLERVHSAESEVKALEELGRYTNSDRFYVTKAGEDLLLGYKHANQRPEAVDMSVFAEALGIEEKDEQVRLYNRFIDLCLMRDAWEKAASKGQINPPVSDKTEKGPDGTVIETVTMPRPGELRGEEGVYDEDRVVVFNYVVSSVRDGKNKEEILADVPETFTEEQKQVVETFTSDYEILTRGVAALDTFVAAKTTSYVAEEVVTPEEDNMFNFLKNASEQLGVGKGELKGKEIGILYVKDVDGRPVEALNPTKLAQLFGLDEKISKEDAANLYSGFAKMIKLSDVWMNVAQTNEIGEDGVVQANNRSAWKESNRETFNYIVNSVKAGTSAEEIIEQAMNNEKFDVVDMEIISTMVNDHYDIIKDAATIYYQEPVKEEDNELTNNKKAAIKEVIAELVEKKYGKAKVVDTEPVVTDGQGGSNDDELVVTDDAIGVSEDQSVEPGDDVVAEEEPVIADNDSYVTRIARAVDNVAKLIKARDQLDALNVESQKQIEALNALIEAELAKIDELTKDRMVSLGKTEEEKNVKVDEEVVVDEAVVGDVPNGEDTLNSDGVAAVDADEDSFVVELVDEIVDKEKRDSVAEFEEEVQPKQEVLLTNEELDKLFEQYEFKDGIHNFRVCVDNFDDAKRYVCAVDKLLFDHERSTIQIDRVPVQLENVVEVADAEVPVYEETVVAGDNLEGDAVVADAETPVYEETVVVGDNLEGDAVVADAEAPVYEETVVVGDNLEGDAVVADAEAPVYEEAVVAEVENTVSEEVSEEDEIAWWTRMAPVLDDPDQELLSRVNLAQRQKDEMTRRAADAFFAKKENERREEIAAATRERSAALRENDATRRDELASDPEKHEKRARAILDANDLKDVDISFLTVAQRDNPELYKQLYDTYINLKREELRSLSASLTSEDSVGSVRK